MSLFAWALECCFARAKSHDLAQGCRQCSGVNFGDGAYCCQGCEAAAALAASAPPPAPIQHFHFPDPRAPQQQVGLLAFYYPGYEESWDTLCGAGFLGNFYPLSESMRLTAFGEERTFHNSEAAFQALKFWKLPEAEGFSSANGNEAFWLKKKLYGQEDFTYGGFGSNWDAMWAVLRAKFRKGSKLAEALISTGDAFLLEHNSQQDRDKVWSDNEDGSGANWLGLQLMLLRAELAPGSDRWGQWLQEEVNLQTGAPLRQGWQAAVQAAAAEVRKAQPGPVCIAPGCSWPTYNGQPNEYCSRTCQRKAQQAAAHEGGATAATVGPLCSANGCQRPTFNGRPGYCSRSCRDRPRGY